MAQVSGDLVIRCEVEEVFDFVADERNAYDPRRRSAELLGDPPVGVGTRFRTEVAVMGRPVEMLVENTEYDRPRRLASVTKAPGIEVHSRLFFEPEHGATRLVWTSRLTASGPGRAARPSSRPGRAAAEARHLGQSAEDPRRPRRQGGHGGHPSRHR